jgi:glutaredoxin 3
MQTAPLPEHVDGDVVAYVTAYCGFCRAAEHLLKTRGINFVAIDVSRDRTARAWLVERSGQSTVPQIFIKGRAIGGYTELAGLDARGELRELLAG